MIQKCGIPSKREAKDAKGTLKSTKQTVNMVGKKNGKEKGVSNTNLTKGGYHFKWSTRASRSCFQSGNLSCF